MSVRPAFNNAVVLGLVSVIVSVTAWPILAWPRLNALATVGGNRITVESFTVLFAALAGGSPPPDRLAVFTSVVEVVAVMLAVTLMAGALAPAANTPLLEQLTTCPDTEQVQPAPDADTGVIPAGKVSVTVMTLPSVAPDPMFCAVKVNTTPV